MQTVLVTPATPAVPSRSPVRNCGVVRRGQPCPVDEKILIAGRQVVVLPSDGANSRGSRGITANQLQQDIVTFLRGSRSSAGNRKRLKSRRVLLRDQRVGIQPVDARNPKNKTGHDQNP